MLAYVAEYFSTISLYPMESTNTFSLILTAVSIEHSTPSTMIY